MVERQTIDDMKAWPDSAFWHYSLDLYQQNGVETACVALQDRRGVDVNLMLLAFWLASRGVALDPAGMDKIETAIACFRAEVVRPLRSVRRHLRRMERSSEPPSIAGCWPDQLEWLRRQVAAAELDGEHLIQLALERASVGLPRGSVRGAALAAANLRLVAPFEDIDREDVTVLFLQAFDGVTKPDLARIFQEAGLLEAG